MSIEHKNETYNIDGVSIQEVAEKFGTPCFVYSEKSISENFKEIRDIFCNDSDNKRSVYYSVKANSNLSILKLLSSLGAGFDIVSMGELDRVTKIGVDPKKIVYSGSSSCYGIPDEYPTRETAEIRPQYPYALTKYLGEQLVLHWCQV